jgi:uncharacterized protein YPO0396
MDDITMKLGLLMETAQTQQKSAESSLKKLKAAANDLAAIVRDEVRRAALEEFQSLAADSRRASDALREVQRATAVRTLVWSVLITLFCSAIVLGLARWVIPSRTEIETLRAKRDALSTQIASLEARGGRIDLKRCGDGTRLCVRVDRRAPIYGEQSDYVVIRGY